MRFLTAGESHGKGLTGILEGVPADLYLNQTKIAEQLNRRRMFYGRSERMQLEGDSVDFLSGIRNEVTTGSPIAFFIKNNDRRLESPDNNNILAPITKPRPGHADYAGMIKYGIFDGRDIAERASGRETATRTVIGAIARQILDELSIALYSHVTNIGGIKSSFGYYGQALDVKNGKDIKINNDIFSADNINAIADKNKFRCLDEKASVKMEELINKAKEAGDTVGGEAEIIVKGLLAGFGSHIQFDKRLDYKIGGMLMSIPSVKGVQIGNKDIFCGLGSAAADPIVVSDERILRPKNYNGGIEGGISNGADIVASVTVKPVPTMKNGADTIDIATGLPALAHYERSDICVVPAISVIAENMLAYVIADTILSELGADTMTELKERFLQRKEKGNVFNKDRK